MRLENVKFILEIKRISTIFKFILFQYNLKMLLVWYFLLIFEKLLLSGIYMWNNDNYNINLNGFFLKNYETMVNYNRSVSIKCNKI